MTKLEKYIIQRNWIEKNKELVTQKILSANKRLYEELIMEKIEKAMITDDLRKPYYNYTDKKPF